MNVFLNLTKVKKKFF